MELGNIAYMKGDWAITANEYDIAHDHKKTDLESLNFVSNEVMEINI